MAQVKGSSDDAMCKCEIVRVIKEAIIVSCLVQDSTIDPVKVHSPGCW